jgi:hypothetical protein
LRARCSVDVLSSLYQRARVECPRGFPADETRSLAELYRYLPPGFITALADDLAEQLALPRELFATERFSIQGAGPVSLHDDQRNYPDWYFIIVVAHAGRLGLVDADSCAAAHQPGDIVLLDPHQRHALVPIGQRAEDWRCAPPDTCALEVESQFLFLDFEVDRHLVIPVLEGHCSAGRAAPG